MAALRHALVHHMAVGEQQDFVKQLNNLHAPPHSIGWGQPGKPRHIAPARGHSHSCAEQLAGRTSGAGCSSEMRKVLRSACAVCTKLCTTLYVVALQGGRHRRGVVRRGGHWWMPLTVAMRRSRPSGGSGDSQLRRPTCRDLC